MASSSYQRCLSLKGRRIDRVLLLSMALIVGVPRIGAAELWDYLRVGKDYGRSPWAARSGKAQVEIRGDHVEIRVDYADANKGQAGCP
jgi:hypothetical protein